MKIDSPVKLGFVPSHRGFFSAPLAIEMRKQALDAMRQLGIDVIAPDLTQTKHGCVETLAEAETCAVQFRDADVSGIVIGAMNFGDEQAAAWVVRQARLNVPVFIFGCQEDGALSRGASRRDAFCGLLSIGETLRQIGAEYSIGERPICFPTDASFRRDIDDFARVCRIVQGVRNARYGQVGARPDAFWTCRFDEKGLQKLGPTTVVLDLSEVFSAIERMKDGTPVVTATAEAIRDYASSKSTSAAAILKMAKLEVFLRDWARDQRLDAMAIQCWTSIQKNLGICSCGVMSRLGDIGIPAACEADVMGALSMHACQLASGEPAALADWNNLHHEDDDLVNLWHCGVFPKSFAKEKPRMGVHDILAGVAKVVEPEQAEGVVELTLKEMPLTLSRITQDSNGSWNALVVEGRVEDNSAATTGSYGWCRIPRLQSLYRDVLLRKFPHHVAFTSGTHAGPLVEAFSRYLKIETFHHQP